MNNDKLVWRKSSRSSGSGQCVSVAEIGGGVRLLRDDKDPEGAVLAFTAEEWAAFIGGVKDGEFD